MKDQAFSILQAVGRSFMLPVAILPIAGLLLGIGASFMIKSMVHWPIDIQGWTIVMSFAVCTMTGVFFGWYPAKKAAQLDPIEALRYE